MLVLCFRKEKYHSCLLLYTPTVLVLKKRVSRSCWSLQLLLQKEKGLCQNRKNDHSFKTALAASYWCRSTRYLIHNSKWHLRLLILGKVVPQSQKSQNPYLVHSLCFQCSKGIHHKLIAKTPLWLHDLAQTLTVIEGRIYQNLLSF